MAIICASSFERGCVCVRFLFQSLGKDRNGTDLVEAGSAWMWRGRLVCRCWILCGHRDGPQSPHPHTDPSTIPFSGHKQSNETNDAGEYFYIGSFTHTRVLSASQVYSQGRK